MRTTSFSDMPLKLPEDAPRRYDTFPARYVSQYIDYYVRHHVYDNRSLRDRIRLNTEVMGIERSSRNGWSLQLKDSTTRSTQSIRCFKLAVASGLTSHPNMPTFPRHSEWIAPVLHHRDFGARIDAVLSANSPYKHITVLGGGKSAADMVYAALQSSKNLCVSWIIRQKGEGPGFFLHAAPKGKYRNAAEPMLSQNATQINPSGFRQLPPDFQSLHQTESGRSSLDERFTAVDRGAKAWAKYREREDALPDFHKLEPSAS